MLQAYNIPIGSIIRLRSRLWRVDNLSDDTIEVTSIEGNPQVSRRFLIPLEDISLAKLEIPSADKVGNFSAQQLMVRAFKLSMIHGTAPLMSLQRSRVVPETFQMVPVVMALEIPRVRMLIADDVGLGKTIEVGLIITELLARKKAKKLLIICPANLREQWMEAMTFFFHINAKIISSRHRREMERRLPPGRDPWDYFPFLIVSMDYAKDPENKAQILEEKWDIIIIDEAHNLAKPHQINEWHRVEMARWDLAKEVSKRTRHLILLTATPHNGYTDTFASLLRILDIGAVSGPDHDPIIDKEIAKKYVCQRRRKDIEQEMNHLHGEKSPFPRRDTEEVVVELSELESNVIKSIELFGKYILDVANAETPHKQRIAKWTVTHFRKRALSSPRALVKSIVNRLKKISKLLEDESLHDEHLLKEEEAKAAVLDNDPGEKNSEEIAGTKLETYIVGNNEALIKEMEVLELALSISKKVTAHRDSKLRYMLANTLRKLLRERSKVIIFTKYKDTLDYLSEQIPIHRHFKGTTVVTLYGELNETQRKDRFKEFEKAGTAIMIATDAISEGLNLQYIASQIIHYELPWNPNRLEQRNGRIDRYGQPRNEVKIRTMVVNDPLEAAILNVLVKKADTIRKDYGFSPPFFGDEISIIDLIREQGIDLTIGQTKIDKFCNGLSSGVPTKDPFSQEVVQRMQEDNFYGQSSIDLSYVRTKMRNAENLIGSTYEIEEFIKSGFNKFSCQMSQNFDDTFKLEINNTNLLRNYDKETIERCTFNPMRGRGDADLEVIDLGHPVVENMISMIKDLTFRTDKDYGRTACIATRLVEKVTAVYTLIVRYAVQTIPVSVIEESLSIGCEIYGSNMLINESDLVSLQRAIPEPFVRTIDEMRDDLREALSKDLDGMIREKTLQRCNELANERRRIKQNLAEKSKPEWMEGMDMISVASVDLLCVTIYYPVRY